LELVELIDGGEPPRSVAIDDIPVVTAEADRSVFE
jgi:hypothetical protein